MNGPVLRAPVLWVAGQRWFRSLITEHSIGRRVALRFVAGEALEASMQAARELDRHGIATMLDHLGENVTSAEQAGAAADAYALALKRVHEADDLDANISIKLTQLGLDLSYDLAMENAERVLQAAASRRTLVMIDMESHEYVDPTLRAHRELRQRFGHVGLALQSYLYRTRDDVEGLPEASTVRLVKGAYLEPHDVAYPDRADVDRSFARLFATLLARRPHGAHREPRPAHDRRGAPVRRAQRHRVGAGGVPVPVRDPARHPGRPGRPSVPGSRVRAVGNEWYPYLTRRMAERPANMWFFVSQFLRFGGGRQG